MVVDGWSHRPSPIDGYETGQVWKRREALGDPYDLVTVVGFARHGEDGIHEPVVCPVEFGTALTVDPAAFESAYEVEASGA